MVSFFNIQYLQSLSPNKFYDPHLDVSYETKPANPFKQYIDLSKLVDSYETLREILGGLIDDIMSALYDREIILTF